MIYGERIKQARESLGLTQTEFAGLLDVSQTTIARLEANASMELGLTSPLEPSDPLLQKISLRTGFPVTFFREPLKEPMPFGSLLYRSRASVSSRDRMRAFRLFQLYMEVATDLTRRLNTPPVRLPRLTEDPVTAARITRSALGLPPDEPIPGLIRTLERAGVLVFVLPMAIEGLDAFSAWPEDSELPPAIAILETEAGDRQRFSIGHEIGELVVNFQPRGSVKEMEDRANTFAAEFLAPEEAMRRELLAPVTLLSVAQLKRRWGVSMQFFLMRAKQLEIISQRQYRYLQKKLVQEGWQKSEPENLNVPPEFPKAPLKITELLYGSPPDLTRMSSDVHRSESYLSRMLSAQRGERPERPEKPADVIAFRRPA